MGKSNKWIKFGKLIGINKFLMCTLNIFINKKIYTFWSQRSNSI